MKKIIRLVNNLLICSLLFSGCARQRTEEFTEEPVMEEVQEPEGITEDNVRERLHEIADLSVRKDWAAVTAAFSRNPLAGDNYESFTEEGCEVGQLWLTYNSSEKGGYARFDCEKSSHLMTLRLHDDLKIDTLSITLFPEMPEAEENEIFYEEVITVGKDPGLYGVLTIPKKTESPSVALLMPDGFRNDRDMSGKDTTFRRDLAWMLAEQGIASLRYDQRLYQNPLLIRSNLDYSLETILYQDFASAVHMLEKYPVDAEDILLIGSGTGAAFALDLVYHHFEINGGIILLEPSGYTGTELFASLQGLDSSAATAAKDALENGQTADVIGGYPLYCWKEWKDSAAEIYGKYVSSRILLLSNRTADRNWKKILEEAVYTEKIYDEKDKLGPHFREESGELSRLIAEDIADWLQGIDINEKKRVK